MESVLQHLSNHILCLSDTGLLTEDDCYASTMKKLMGHIAFGASVGACVRHTFCTYCYF